jgi:riboflavin kinase / FMN adenylyltransferase
VTQHIYNLANVNLTEPSLVTIGVFDGVHRGHQHLIQQLVEDAHRSDRLAVVLTFFPHPDVVLRGLSGRYYLTTAEQKADLLIQLGVDYVVTQTFDDALRQVRAADFVDQLRESLNMAALAVGADFTMGYKREGNVDFLREQGAQKGFDLRVIDLIANDSEIISSTAIRHALEAGDVALARKWLGRSYSLTGMVVHGAKRGRQIGYPTANTQVWDQQVIPANGIYAGWVYLHGERYMAATNVGIRPMFEGDDITVEPYILDFNQELYGETLTVTFEKRLRDEAKFDSLDALIAQIGADVEASRAYLSAQSEAG